MFRLPFALQSQVLTHSLICHFETVPNSDNLKTTTEMWLLKDLKRQIAQKTFWKKVKLLILSNFTFFHNIFLKIFSSMCYNGYIWRKGLMTLRGLLCSSVVKCMIHNLKAPGLNWTESSGFFMCVTLSKTLHGPMQSRTGETQEICESIE